MKKRRGFTLVELIVVIAVTAIFGSIVLVISTTSGKLFSMTQEDSYINDEARLGLYVLEEDLRIGKEIDCVKDMGLNGNSTIDIGSTSNVICSNIGLPLGTFNIILKVNVRGEWIYYINYLDKLERMKFDGGIFKSVNTVTSFKEAEITKGQTDTSDKRYFINIKFEDSKGNIQEYKSTISPRN